MKTQHRTLVYLLLSIVLIASISILVYGTSPFMAPSERTITKTTTYTTASSAATAIATSTVTITTTAVSTKTATMQPAAPSTITAVSTSTKTEIKTETTTTTTTATGQQPELLHPSGPSAIIRSRILLNRSILMIVSMDKSSYNLLETVHIKGTVTNLTPRQITIQLTAPGVLVRNGTKIIWVNPEENFDAYTIGYLGPPWITDMTLNPGETATVDYLTTDWDLIGLHLERSNGWNRIVSDQSFIPGGNYTITWNTGVSFSGSPIKNNERFAETANFEFNK